MQTTWSRLRSWGVGLIDIVAVNLYPFKETISKSDVTLEDAIENIDIGGPTMLRAAAKNWQDVASIVDPADYSRVLEELKNGGVTKQTKFDLCVKVFEHTAAYDALISGYLRQQNGGGYPEKLTFTYEKIQNMRYGENPHQTAAFYKEPLGTEGTLAAAEQLWGKELSFNNINDTNGALDCLREFDEITVVASKHANPCGVGSGETVYDAYIKAYTADPVSVYGGIVAVNTEVDRKTAEEMVKIFLEIVIAPSFTDDALEVLKTKKNLRILRLPDISSKIKATALDLKKPLGGLIVQQPDTKLFDGDLKVVTKVAPTEEQMKDLVFAWKLVKHLKSNAISVAKNKQSLGLGPGQVSRIWAAENALQRSGENVKGAALASDAYFPFDDSVRLAAKFGISAIIQPGGSIRDGGFHQGVRRAGHCDGVHRYAPLQALKERWYEDTGGWGRWTRAYDHLEAATKPKRDGDTLCAGQRRHLGYGDMRTHKSDGNSGACGIREKREGSILWWSRRTTRCTWVWWTYYRRKVYVLLGRQRLALVWKAARYTPSR